MTENIESKRPKTETPKKTASSAKKKETALKAQIESLTAERDAAQDRYVRAVAEMDNVRKRKDREMALLLDTASEGVLRALLPVMDDLDRSLKIPNDPDHALAFREGVEMIAQKLAALLKQHGVEPMVSIGQPFDVDRHDALMQVEAPDTEPDIVVEEHERGYLIRDRVLRHAKVLVSR